MSAARYRFDELNWYQFETLCQALLKQAFGVGIESWGGSGDQGRDAHYHGRLPIPTRSDAKRSQRFVFQVKFVSNASAVGSRPGPALRKAVLSELARIRPNVDCYVLITNVPTGGALHEEIKDLLGSSLPRARIVVWGAGDVSDHLDAHPTLRTAYPQLLSIRDLSALLDEVLTKPQRNRSRLFVQRGIEAIRSFAPVRPYYEALDKLTEHSMVVLAGPPESGKSTIAHVIGLVKAQEGWECVDCRSPEDFLRLHEPDAAQVFVADDAFGTTEYAPSLAEAWVSDLDNILRLVDAKHWFVWTSRTAPLEMALRQLHFQGRAERFPDPARITVDSSRLAANEKALILFRQARAAELDVHLKSMLRSCLRDILTSKHFTPLRVRRLVNEWLRDVAKEEIDETGFRERAKVELSAATTVMRNSFNRLSDAHKAVLIALLDTDSGGLERSWLRHASVQCNASLSDLVGELEGHFVSRRTPAGNIPQKPSEQEGQGVEIRWLHPSWRDLVIDHLADSPVLRRRFLASCGLTGFALALSTGGGVSGERRFPLLKSPDDWTHLGANVRRICRELQPEDAAGMLVTVRHVIVSSDVVPDGVELSVWAADALDEVRTLWCQSGRTLTLGEVRAYYLLSEEVRPLPPSVDLRSTWKALTQSALHELGKDGGPVSLPRTEEWLSLIHVIAWNEPRFLRQVGLLRDYEGIVQRLLDVLEGARGSLRRETFSRSDCLAEMGQREALERICAQVESVFPAHSAPAQRLRVRFEQERHRIGLRMAKDFPVRKSPLLYFETPDEVVSVDRFFEDL